MAPIFKMGAWLTVCRNQSVLKTLKENTVRMIRANGNRATRSLSLNTVRMIRPDVNRATECETKYMHSGSKASTVHSPGSTLLALNYTCARDINRQKASPARHRGCRDPRRFYIQREEVEATGKRATLRTARWINTVQGIRCT